jgi:hypothetical protein
MNARTVAVLVVFGGVLLLLAIVIPKFNGRGDPASDIAAAREIQVIQPAQDQYRS